MGRREELTLAYFGIESSGVNLVINLLIVFVAVAWLALIWWTYTDAQRRIADPMLVGCAVAASLFPFVGTMVYAILRPPEYLEDVHERDVELRAAEVRLAQLEHNLCPHCEAPTERDFLVCPNCLTKLKERCGSCSRPLEPAWTVCPYCETEVPGAIAARRAGPRGAGRRGVGAAPREPSAERGRRGVGTTPREPSAGTGRTGVGAASGEPSVERGRRGVGAASRQPAAEPGRRGAGPPPREPAAEPAFESALGESPSEAAERREARLRARARRRSGVAFSQGEEDPLDLDGGAPAGSGS
ncbi:MAG: zinc ribbon domain-containing protein [Solirubrobacterales bacterium]|nr:zinc ribbon domain-containing protein [Solirubrobacterales bacterium]